MGEGVRGKRRRCEMVEGNVIYMYMCIYLYMYICICMTLRSYGKNNVHVHTCTHTCIHITYTRTVAPQPTCLAAEISPSDQREFFL